MTRQPDPYRRRPAARARDERLRGQMHHPDPNRLPRPRRRAGGDGCAVTLVAGAAGAVAALRALGRARGWW